MPRWIELNRLLLLIVACATTGIASHCCAQSEKAASESVAGNDEVAEFMKNYAGRGVMSDGSQPTPAAECVPQFQVHLGFEVELVASEPDVSQPLFLSWDSRGRLWTVQYRQYQFPAGLKIMRYDQHLRAVYDKVPQPPPLGVSGKDVITVFEDSDGDGRYDTHHDVIGGLNIATSVQVGHGGIWVLNPPYLLFYPDADRDDAPDGPPQVRLSGFGLQDTHSVANSLLWGPDGWLYGANGSTTAGVVSSSVSKGVAFEGQCIWRYHPDSQVFEIYAEGGGNTFSLDIDSQGRVFSGTNGGSTRGFYYPQGSYSSKNWGKHGPLTNPYAFGYFEAMPSKGDTARFPQAFTIYEGGLFPAEFTGNIIAPNAMKNLVWNSKRIVNGSTYRTEDEQDLCSSPDRWFRPVYGGVGPDGAVYLADWYDTRLSHVSPVDDWHKESGRIYRIFPTDTPPSYTHGDLHIRSSNELTALFEDANKWVRQRAVLELGWRGDHSIVAELEKLVDERQSLEALWALGMLEELDARRATRWLSSDSAAIRRWVVRLLGDQHRDLDALVDLAAREADVQVRSQLASTAKRVSPKLGLAIIGKLLTHSEDIEDPHLPLMIWWGLEAHAEQWPMVQELFGRPELWRLPMVPKFIAGRLMQRYATTSDPKELDHCRELVELAPDEASRQALLEGLLRAFEGRTLPTLPEALSRQLATYQQSLGDAGLVIGLQQQDSAAVARAIELVSDTRQPLGLRSALVRSLGEAHPAAAQATLMKLANGGTDEPALQRVALVALRQFDDQAIGQQLVGQFGGAISAEHSLRDTACRTLATRKAWAVALLDEVLAWRLRPQDIPVDVAQQLRAYDDPQVAQLAERALGKAVVISSEEKLQQMDHLQQLWKQQPADPKAGKDVFAKKCGVCHQLFGEGSTIGPALDAYERGNPRFWLVAMVEPSAEIREGFQSYAALTVDGRLVTGMLAEQTAHGIAIRSADNQLTTIATEDLEALRALTTSLMPEDVLKDLDDKQIGDLFAYLRSGLR